MLKRIFEFLKEMFTGRGIERPSPKNRIYLHQFRTRHSQDEYELAVRDLFQTVEVYEMTHDTNSMDGYGLIDLGAKVIVSDALPYLDTVGIGDIVWWEKDGLRRLHQVVKIEGGKYYTRGTNLNSSDNIALDKDDIKKVVLGVFW